MEADGPIRTCTGCRARRPQAELLRVVRRPDGSFGIGRGEGRGAYVCPARECIAAALSSGTLRRALRAAGHLPDDLRVRLLNEVS